MGWRDATEPEAYHGGHPGEDEVAATDRWIVAVVHGDGEWSMASWCGNGTGTTVDSLRRIIETAVARGCWVEAHSHDCQAVPRWNSKACNCKAREVGSYEPTDDYCPADAGEE